jgi:CheY-like chemotaxis protein
MEQPTEANMKMRIMLVDDTPANIDVLRKTLERNDYEIAVAPNGEMTLKIAPRFNPDLILLDVMMPGIDGYETCQKLKSMEETKSIPVIFITAKNEPEDIIKGFMVGGVDYITKPFRQQEVCARVHNQLALKSYENERKALIKDLENQNIRLENLDEVKNNLLGMAAHDLRNPLASVRGFSEMLIENEGNLDEDSKEMLKMIQDISNHMLDLVNDLLDFSVIESGNLHLEPRQEKEVSRRKRKLFFANILTRFLNCLWIRAESPR